MVPISHGPPNDPNAAVEAPAQAKRRLGLDVARSWAVAANLNRCHWPGPDLRLAPGAKPPSNGHGLPPAKLFLRIRQSRIYIASARGAVVRRTD